MSRARRRRRRVASGTAIAAAAAVTSLSAGAIDLTLVPVETTYAVGDTVEIQLFAASDSPETQFSAAMLACFVWDAPALAFDGLDQAGATSLLSIGFPGIYGPNESDPPLDGDGALQVLAPFGNPIPATPDGTLITTFRFEAVSATAFASMSLVPAIGDVATVVFDGDVPNLDVTGELGAASVTIVPGPASSLVVLAGALTIGQRRRRGAGIPRQGVLRCPSIQS